jgi:transposase InsO family protein
MTRELQDKSLKVDRRRTARLMRENGLKARQMRRFKRTTDSHHGLTHHSIGAASTALLSTRPC